MARKYTQVICHSPPFHAGTNLTTTIGGAKAFKEGVFKTLVMTDDKDGVKVTFRGATSIIPWSNIVCAEFVEVAEQAKKAESA